MFFLFYNIKEKEKTEENVAWILTLVGGQPCTSVLMPKLKFKS